MRRERVNITVLGSAVVFLHGGVLLKNEHRFFEWCWDGCLMDREFERRGCRENSYWESVRGSWTFPEPSWPLSQMTQSVMNADSCLAETVGCFNNISELLFYNCLSNCLCEYKIHVIYSECSH